MAKSIEDQLVAHWADEQHGTFDQRTAIEGSGFWDPTIPPTLDQVHSAMIVAGMTPGAKGLFADTVALGTSLIQGNWGEALWDAASIVPVFGYFVAQKRLSQSGEIIPLYRGVEKPRGWDAVTQGKTDPYGSGMDFIKPPVKGKYLGESPLPEGGIGRLYVTLDPEVAFDFAKGISRGNKIEGKIMKFEVPADYIKKHGVIDKHYPDERAIFFDKGLPEQYLKGAAGADDILKTRIIKQTVSTGKVTKETILDVSKNLPKTLGSAGDIRQDIKTSEELYKKLLKDPSYVTRTLDDFLTTSHREIDEMVKRMHEASPTTLKVPVEAAREFISDPLKAKKLYETKVKTANIELAIADIKEMKKNHESIARANKIAIEEAMKAIENIE